MAIFPHLALPISVAAQELPQGVCLSTCFSMNSFCLRSVWDCSRGRRYRSLYASDVFLTFCPHFCLPILGTIYELDEEGELQPTWVVLNVRRIEACSERSGICSKFGGFASSGCVWRCYYYCGLQRNAAAADDVGKLNGGGGRYFSFLPGNFSGLLSCCFKTTMKFWLHCCSSDHGAADVGLVSAFDGVEGHQPEALTWVMEWGPEKNNKRKNKRFKTKKRLYSQPPQRYFKAVFHESIAVREVDTWQPQKNSVWRPPSWRFLEFYFSKKTWVASHY